MPRRDVRMYLDDIVRACDHAMAHVRGATEEHFRATRSMQAAVEREFQILAEALVQAIKQEPAIKARITDAVASGRSVSELPSRSSNVYISLLTISVVSPIGRLNTSVNSKIGVAISR